MSKAAELAALIGSGQAQENKNLVINGAMTVDQRNQTTTATGYTVDRFSVAKSNFDELVIAITQDTDNPSGNGFAHSLKLAVTTAESAIAADELLYLDTRFEGQNIQHLCYGTSSAKSLTLSFWVKSPLAGKHAVNFYQTTPARSNLQSYTVSSANTWEYKTITIDGDTSGNIANDTTAEIILFWPLAGGSDYHGTPHTGWGAYTGTDDFMFSDQVNLAGQTGNFFLTGVQLEVGEVATAFEHEDYGTTLAKCQRYFENIEFTNGSVVTVGQVYSSHTAAAAPLRFKVTKRAAPTVTLPPTGRNTGNINFLMASAGYVPTSDGSIAVNFISVDSCTLQASGYNTFGANGDASWVYMNGAATITVAAEL